jgi:DHA2 family multidrug resistance protein-like MFS transporter
LVLDWRKELATNEIAPLQGFRFYLAIFAVLLGTFMSNLDAAIANIAIPVISTSLHSAAATTVWVVNAYQLTMAVCILPLAALADRLGYRYVHLAGLTIFVIGSVVCAASPSVGMLVAARAFQGIGGACLAIVGPALVRIIVPHSMAVRALAWLATIVALSASTGPSVAALILKIASWPWLFWVNVPIGVVVFAAAASALPKTKGPERTFDTSGALYGGLALALLIIGVADLGAPDGHAAVKLVAALIIAGFFVAHQRHREHAILPNDLLAIPVFSMSLATSICAYAAQSVALVSLPFLLEHTFGRSVQVSGILLTPWPLVIVFVAPMAARLTAKYNSGVLCAVGLAMLGGGLLLCAALPSQASNWDIAWRLTLCGAGFGLYQTPNNKMVMTTGPLNRSGAASAMMSLSRLIGMSLGAAVATVLLTQGIQHATGAALVIGAAISGLGIVMSLLRMI